MANIKFSNFDAGGSGDAGTTQLVGFKVGDTSANYKYSITDLATMLSSSISTIYTANSSLTAARTVTMGTYNLAFASSTAGQEVSFGQNVKISGQGYTELHTGTTPVDPDWNNGNIQESTLVSGSNDFDPSNPKAGATYILKLTQPGTADGTVNWDNIGAANIKWPGGTEPTLTASAAAVDIITLICTDATGQGVYYASATLDMQ